MTVFSWEAFDRVPIIGILRGLPQAALGPLVDAVRRGGLTTLEVTLNSPGALDQIREAAALGEGWLNVGAGTVLSPEDLEGALAAGAGFIVTPIVQRRVIQECARRGIPVFPGALTPNEVLAAAELGARWVKVFPADVPGPGYLRHLREVVPETGLLPTGGVDLETLPAFRQAGAGGFGIGSPLFQRGRIEAGDWRWIEERCRAWVDAVTAKIDAWES